MAHIVKCLYCSSSFDRDKVPFVAVTARRYAHEACQIEHEKNKTQEEKELESLEKFIMKLFNITFINARIKSQIKQMREKYNYSYSGILKSLIYFFDIKGNPIEKANGGIGIVPYVYDDAYRYYFELFQAQEKNKNKKVEEFISNVVEIRIPSPQRQSREKKRFTFLDKEE